MFALDLLRVQLARIVLVGIEMPCVRAPMIRMKTGEPEGLQQRFQRQKDIILAPSEHMREDLPGVVINRMPQPPLVFLFPDKAPVVHNNRIAAS